MTIRPWRSNTTTDYHQALRSELEAKEHVELLELHRDIIGPVDDHVSTRDLVRTIYDHALAVNCADGRLRNVWLDEQGYYTCFVPETTNTNQEGYLL